MYKPFTKKLLVSIAALALASTPLQAAKLDLEQEILITAGRTAGDLKNKIATYLDNVKISQGTLSIKADLVQVYNEKDHDTETYIAKGKPAVFEQQLDDGTIVHLEAQEIKYEPLISTITISGKALLRQAGSEVSGDKIIYNISTEQLEAEGGNDTVTTILKPRAKSDK